MGASELSEAWALSTPLIAAVDAGLRGKVAAEWARIAQLEHASIAAFSRFSIELLVLGAPPELLEASHQAALDEIRHARHAFALASAYAGSPVGPGAFPYDEVAFRAPELEAVVRATVSEGCVGETLAAAEAEAASEVAQVPCVRQVLAGIAQDESRHAALAFRFVAWAAAQYPQRVRQPISEQFEQTIELHRVAAVLQGTQDRELRAHGILPATERRELRLKTLSDVIRPAQRALCAGW